MNKPCWKLAKACPMSQNYSVFEKNNLLEFNCYLHIPSFKMPTIRHVWQLIQHGDYAFFIDLQDAYSHIPIVKHHHHFLQFVWHSLPYQWKSLPFALATASEVFTALTKCILFLCHSKGFCIVIHFDDILVLVCPKQAGRRAHSFLCSLLVQLGLHINLSRSDLCFTNTFCFLGLCWYTVHMSVSLPPGKLPDIQQPALSLLQNQHVTIHRVMSSLGKANFSTNGHSQLWHLCHVIQSDMLYVTILPPVYFLMFIFPFPPNIQWNSYLIYNRAQFLCNFLFLMWLLLLMSHTHWAFLFSGIWCTFIG